PDCTQATAAQRAEEMREAIAASRRTGDAAADVQITASFGVAATKVCGYNLPTLLANADHALYAAKNAGRSRSTGLTALASGLAPRRAMRKRENAEHDQHEQRGRCRIAAQFEAPVGAWLVEKIADHCAQRPRENEC